MKYLLGILVTAALFLLLGLLVAVKPKTARKITAGMLVFAGISSFLLYGYGFISVTDNLILAVFKTLFAVFGCFIGNSEYEAIAAAPYMETAVMQILVVGVQVCALYATASAVAVSIGREAMKRLRLKMIRRNHISVILGTCQEALSFGKELAQRKREAVVFVAEEATGDAEAAAEADGSVLRTDLHAVNGDRKFLRSIGFGKGSRKLTLYALEKNSAANIQYAKQLLKALQQSNVAPEQLQLVVLAREEVAVSHLQATPDKYGYGFVTAVTEPQMAARLLTLKYPPYKTVTFDETGKACEDFEALLIGFGQVGQAVLRSLVMNGQFEGSKFRMAVFSPDCKEAEAGFFRQHQSLCKAYDISFYNGDGRSEELYRFLDLQGGKLKYVAVCTGNEKMNREIAEDLTKYFYDKGYTVPVFKCSGAGVDAYAPDGTVTQSHKLYSTQLLRSSDLDRRAMVLNHRYQANSDSTALENWLKCDYFSRQSCRASADFVPAMLYAVGKTPEQVAEGDWQLTDAQKENLSKTEHLRWCAFHYCMGFSPMENEEFAQRAQMYRQQMQQEGKATVRIGKNMQGKTHACLVSWEELDILSKKEEAVTGKYVDYKMMDTDNVLAIPELLKQIEQ